MKESAKIFILYYKPGLILPLGEEYEPLFCGYSNWRGEFDHSKDNSGISISPKNQWYSELTGIYWVWKNSPQEITGFCHYRRYFTSYPEPWHLRLKYLITHPFKTQKGPNPLIYTNNIKKYSKRILTLEQTEFFLNEYDVILPIAREFRYSLKTHYCKYHSSKDLSLIEEVLSEISPEYLPTWFEVLDQNKLYANNMFILKSSLFHEFMEWWFRALFLFEEKSDLETFTGYQKRILGFVGERLLTLWVIHNRLKIKELQLIYFKKFKKE